MKKLFLVPAVAAMFLMAACGGSQNAENNNTANAETESTAPAEAEVSVPGIENEEVTNHIQLEGSDNMKFNKDLFRIKAGEEVQLTLKNVGELPVESMGHNAVVLLPGTDVAAFGGEAAKAADHIPATFTSSIVAHTKLLGPGEEDTITFTVDEAGVYEFVCSFPGHWGTMRGKIVAE